MSPASTRSCARAVTIERSAAEPQTRCVATNYAALDDIASGNYFEPGVTRRVIVLLTDGESNPFDPSAGRERSSASPHGYRFLAVRFWNAERGRVYDANGRPEPGYQPNPASASIISGLAGAIGGRSFSESDVGAAASYLRSLAGTGPTVRTGATTSQQTLAPFVAALAALLLLVAVLPVGVRVRAPGGPRPASRVSGLREGRGLLPKT